MCVVDVFCVSGMEAGIQLQDITPLVTGSPFTPEHFYDLAVNGSGQMDVCDV